MEGRNLAFAKPSEAKKIDITGSDNIYLAALRKLYAEANTPTAEQALLAVMQEYLNKGDGIISQYTLHHKQLATDIKAMLEKRQWVDALTHLSTIKDMATTGDFALALATFFNFFPKHLKPELKPAFEKSLGQDAWRANLNAWLTTFAATHKNGFGSNDHEHLEQIAASVPVEMADEFADFLLSELDNDERPANRKRPDFDRPGLYKGWVCIALGKLADKLSETHKQTVCERLKLMLRSKHEDYSMIGIVIALSKMTKDGDTLANAAATLHDYTTSKLLFLKDSFCSSNPTVSSYLPKLFEILFHFESYYKQEKRDELIQLVTGPNELFVLREGIHTLHSWMQPAERDALLRTLLKEPKFEILFPYFYSWLNKIKCGDKLVEKYYQTNKLCLLELIDEDLQTNFAEHIACIITDSALKPDARKKIFTALTLKVEDSCSNKAFQPEQKNNLYKAISLLAPWFELSPIHTEKLLNALMGALEAHKTQDHALRANLLAAIFTFMPHRDFNSKKYRDELLMTLSKDPDDADINALRIYAKNIPATALPDLLSCLAKVPADKHKAHVLFAELHQLYQHKPAPQEKQEQLNEQRSSRRLR